MPSPVATGLLARWARWVYRFRWLVLALCLVVTAVASVRAAGVREVLYGTTVELPGTPSERVSRALRHDFDNPYAELAVLVGESQRLTLDDAAYRDWLEAAAATLRQSPDVRQVASPFTLKDPRLRSPDGHRAIILIGLAAPSVQEAEKVTPRIRQAVKQAGERMHALDPTFRWATTGRGALSYDLTEYGAHDAEEAESRVVPLTLAILVLAFGALVAAGMPLGVGLVATTLGLGVLAVVGRFTPLSAMTQNVGTMVGLAVGIDYSLLLVARFREALAQGRETPDALAETLSTAGRAVISSGMTVMIGMAGLAFTPSLDTRSIGIGGAIIVAIGVGVALTLLPALLAIAGPRINAPVGLARFIRPFDPAVYWRGWAAWLVRWPWRLALVGMLLLAALCAPLATLSTRYDGSKHLPIRQMEFHTGFDILQAMGRKNASTPIQIVIRSEQAPILAPQNLEALLAYSARLHADPRVLEVLSPVDLATHLKPDQYRQMYRNWQALLGLSPARFGALVSRDRQAAAFAVVPRDDQSFEDMQKLARAIAAYPVPGLVAEVGGQSAFFNDLDDATDRAVPTMVTFVVAATFVVLALAYRCWLVPLKATILNLLSVGAGCGALVAVFQWGWGTWLIGLPHPTEGVPMPLLAMVFCIVFGLSMDYEVFLISRIKEVYDQTGDNTHATEVGLAATGGMITSAALVMVAVFGAFAFAKLTVVKMMGVGLGVAVLVDATIVRVLLAPALMTLAGRWNWHPGGQHMR